MKRGKGEERVKEPCLGRLVTHIVWVLVLFVVLLVVMYQGLSAGGRS